MLNDALQLDPRVLSPSPALKPTRHGYGEGLVDLGEVNPDVVVLTADLSESTRCDEFARRFPERFFNCGVAEQNMAAVAAGLGVTGKIVYISSYATFSPGKNWETIRTTIVYNNSPVKIAGHHSGIVTGPDGATHQATEDIASTRCWPNIRVIVPCDAIEAKKATIRAAQIPAAVYLRFTREKTPVMTTEATPFDGRVHAYWECERPQAVVFATGHLLYYALLAAAELEREGIGVLVANVAVIKPLDEHGTARLAARAGTAVTVEDHQVAGGLGGALAEFFARTTPIPMEFVGLQDTFAESGPPAELIAKYGLGTEAIKAAVTKAIARKQR
jgi:transketolase